MSEIKIVGAKVVVEAENDGAQVSILLHPAYRPFALMRQDHLTEMMDLLNEELQHRENNRRMALEQAAWLAEEAKERF